MSSTLYFAYGSNLLRERLLARCPGMTYAGRATLPGHRLTFDKVSNDGSGKCAFEAVGDSENEVSGVLWNVPAAELDELDRVEGVGHGYERCQTNVRQEGRECNALTYRATNRQSGLQPYDWYLALVIAGATQQWMAEAYIDFLRERPFRRDSDAERRTRREALEALAAANMLHVLEALNGSAARVR